MKRFLLSSISLLPLIVTLGTACTRASGDSAQKAIVGAWEVEIKGAPYQAHLFTFHGDGTMSQTNPARVQENPVKAHGGTNDSLGMGMWALQKIRGDAWVVGTFKQLNANADDHSEAPQLEVSFKIKVNADRFQGPAIATAGGQNISAHLDGRRVQINSMAIQSLPDN